MKELKIFETININGSVPFQAIAFDGDRYYLCAENKNAIYIYDFDFKFIKCYNTMNEYGCICYDSKQKCLWAIPKNNCNIIVKLNKEMQEIGSIKLIKYKEELKEITSISYCCLDNSIIISTLNKIIKISVSNNCMTDVMQLDNICKVICVPPGYIIITDEDDKKVITIYNNYYEITYQMCMDTSLVLCDALFMPCCSIDKKDTCLYLLMKSKCCNCIYNITIDQENFCYKLSKCNFQFCKKEKKCTEACFSDYLESIALIQTAISHILNAEGEKIQKILATTDDFNEILCVNKEVNRTITNVTHLEQVIYDSLLTCIEKCDCDSKCKCDKGCECKCKCADDMNKCICDVDGGNV